MVACFILSKSLLNGHCCKQTIFYFPWWFFSKMGYFCCIKVETHICKYGHLISFYKSWDFSVNIYKYFQMTHNINIIYVEYLCNVPRPSILIWSVSKPSGVPECSRNSQIENFHFEPRKAIINRARSYLVISIIGTYLWEVVQRLSVNQMKS